MRESNPLLWYHLVGTARNRYRRQRALYFAGWLAVGVFYLSVLTFIGRGILPINAIAITALTVVCLIAPLFCYNLFSTEYEKSTWEFLALTRLSAKQILWGKWGSGVILLCVLMVGLLPLLFAMETGAPLIKLVHYALLSFFCVFSWGVLIVSVGTWISFRTRSTVLTASLLYGLQVIVLFLVPFIAALLEIPNRLVASGGSGALSSALKGFQGTLSDWVRFWSDALVSGQFLIWMNPFYTLYEMSDMFPIRWHQGSGWEHSPEVLAMHALGWGWVQSFSYLLWSAVFIFLTYNGIRKHWRK